MSQPRFPPPNFAQVVDVLIELSQQPAAGNRVRAPPAPTLFPGPPARTGGPGVGPPARHAYFISPCPPRPAAQALVDPQRASTSSASSDDADDFDLSSKKGRFGWEKLHGVFVPYIWRRGVKHYAVRVLERQLFQRLLENLTPDVVLCAGTVSYRVSDAEAQLLNEINVCHSDRRAAGDQVFTPADLLLTADDVLGLYEFLLVCRRKLLLSPSAADGCGFVRVGGSVIPYVVPASGIQLVPVFFFEGELDAVLPQAVPVSGWDLARLRFCCKVLGIRDDLCAATSCDCVPLTAVVEHFADGDVVQEFWPAYPAVPMLRGDDEGGGGGGSSRHVPATFPVADGGCSPLSRVLGPGARPLPGARCVRLPLPVPTPPPVSGKAPFSPLTPNRQTSTQVTDAGPVNRAVANVPPPSKIVRQQVLKADAVNLSQVQNQIRTEIQGSQTNADVENSSSRAPPYFFPLRSPATLPGSVPPRHAPVLDPPTFPSPNNFSWPNPFPRLPTPQFEGHLALNIPDNFSPLVATSPPSNRAPSLPSMSASVGPAPAPSLVKRAKVTLREVPEVSIARWREHYALSTASVGGRPFSGVNLRSLRLLDAPPGAEDLLVRLRDIAAELFPNAMNAFTNLQVHLEALGVKLYKMNRAQMQTYAAAKLWMVGNVVHPTAKAADVEAHLPQLRNLMASTIVASFSLPGKFECREN